MGALDSWVDFNIDLWQDLVKITSQVKGVSVTGTSQKKLKVEQNC